MKTKDILNVTIDKGLKERLNKMSVEKQRHVSTLVQSAIEDFLKRNGY